MDDRTVYQKPSLRSQNSWTTKIMDSLPCLMRKWSHWLENMKSWALECGYGGENRWLKVFSASKTYWVSLATIKFFHTWLRKLFLDVFNTLSKIIKWQKEVFLLKLIYSIWTQDPNILLGANYVVNAGDKKLPEYVSQNSTT